MSVQAQAQIQETQKLAPNNIPVPWYSQKITGCPYSHCSLASSLMVFDYFKGMTTDTQRTAQDAEKKLIEYQRNYFLKKRAPFRRRTSIGQGGYYSFEIILQGTGVVMLAGILFCLGVRFPAPKQPQGFPIKEGLGLLKESSLLLLSFILFFQSGIEGVCNNWTTLYLGQTTNIPENRALMALTCMVAGLTVARLLLVVLFKKIKQETVLRASLITAAIGFALLTFSPDFARAAIGMVLVGAGLASTFPVILSIVGSRYASLSGTAFSVALVIALIGQTLLNSLTGIISQGYSIVVYPYMMIASLLIMLLLFKRSLK